MTTPTPTQPSGQPAKPVLHSFNRLRRGRGIEEGITPTCSCGWVGREEFAWNDWQHTNIAEQEAEHLQFLKK